jgi:hypothetical protein
MPLPITEMFAFAPSAGYAARPAAPAAAARRPRAGS